MRVELEISLLGELRVVRQGVEVPLPASRKARALLAFLAATRRPHRRERLCALFWDLPDDPKASLRWALSKVRGVVDTPERKRIVADRERIQFDAAGAFIDVADVHARLSERDRILPLSQLEEMIRRLDMVFLDGLDTAGENDFHYWLASERADTQAARVHVLKQLATHPDNSPIATEKWLGLWQQADPAVTDDPQWVRRETGRSSFEPVAQYRAASDIERLASSSIASSAELPETEFGAASSTTTTKTRELRSQRIGFCSIGDGTSVAYATIGSGAPIVKAANWFNHLEFDWSSPIWGQGFADLARTRTFVRYDGRGCGLSDWDVPNLDFETFVQDLEAVTDKLNLERFPLIGISQGCAVSIEYAVRHPERVSGLIIISGWAAGWRYTMSPDEQEQRKAVQQLTELAWASDNPAYRHFFSLTFMPDASPRVRGWFDDFQRHATSPQNAARFQDAFGYIDVRDKLQHVKAPTLVFHSKYDRRVPIAEGRELASRIPDAHFVPLESGNHILVDDEPAWQVCYETISRFLQEEGI